MEHEISGTGVMMKSYLDHASKVCFIFFSSFFFFFALGRNCWWVLVGGGGPMNYILIICEM